MRFPISENVILGNCDTFQMLQNHAHFSKVILMPNEKQDSRYLLNNIRNLSSCLFKEDLVKIVLTKHFS